MADILFTPTPRKENYERCVFTTILLEASGLKDGLNTYFKPFDQAGGRGGLWFLTPFKRRMV